MENLSIIITFPFPIGWYDGAARMTREIARHLGKCGAHVTLVPIAKGARLYQRLSRQTPERNYLGYEFDEELARDCVQVVRVQQHPLHHLFDAISIKKTLKRIMKQRRVDVVLSYHEEGALLPKFLKSRNIKFGFIAAMSSYSYWDPSNHRIGLRGFIEQQLIRRLILTPYQNADVVFAISKFSQDELNRYLGVNDSRIKVCYLGVDAKFSRIPRARPKKINRFIYFSRIHANKGIYDAIEALGKVAARGLSDWHFYVFGQAVRGQLEMAKQTVNGCGIADNVTFGDALDDAGLLHELELAQVAVMPARFHSFGLANAEAQAAGIPVIGYAAGAVPEVVENGVTGWLAPVGETDQLADYIEAVIRDPEMGYQAGIAGRERITRNFTWESVAASILEGIHSIDNSHGKGQ